VLNGDASRHHPVKGWEKLPPASSSSWPIPPEARPRGRGGGAGRGAALDAASPWRPSASTAGGGGAGRGRGRDLGPAAGGGGGRASRSSAGPGIARPASRRRLRYTSPSHARILPRRPPQGTRRPRGPPPRLGPHHRRKGKIGLPRAPRRHRRRSSAGGGPLRGRGRRLSTSSTGWRRNPPSRSRDVRGDARARRRGGGRAQGAARPPRGGAPTPSPQGGTGRSSSWKHRHLWVRSSLQHALLRVRAEVVAARRSGLNDEGFIRYDTPSSPPCPARDLRPLRDESTSDLGSAYLTQSASSTWSRG